MQTAQIGSECEKKTPGDAEHPTTILYSIYAGDDGALMVMMEIFMSLLRLGDGKVAHSRRYYHHCEGLRVSNCFFLSFFLFFFRGQGPWDNE